MNDARLKPSWWLVLIASILLFGCLVLPALYGALWFIAGDFQGILGLIGFGPLCVWLGLIQYQGTFQARERAAAWAGTTWYVLAALGAFAYFANVGEYFGNGGRSWRVAWGLWPILAFAVTAGAVGLVNRRRARDLREIYARDPELKPRRNVTLRETLVGVGLLVVALGLAASYAGSLPPNDAEHVARDAAPFDLPENATDVSYHLGARGTRLFEFTTDEPSFRRWVEASVVTERDYGDETPLQEISGTRDILRYKYANDGSAQITDGLYYQWRFKDQGRQAAFDRRTQRAYFYGHIN